MAFVEMFGTTPWDNQCSCQSQPDLDMFQERMANNRFRRRLRFLLFLFQQDIECKIVGHNLHVVQRGKEDNRRLNRGNCDQQHRPQEIYQ